MADPKPAAEVWSYTFGERGPDFVLTINGEPIGRVMRGNLPGVPAWSWHIHCLSHPGRSVARPMPIMSGEASTKREAVEGLRAAWAIEREWRRQFREMTATTHGCWAPGYLEAAWWGYGLADDTEPPP